MSNQRLIQILSIIVLAPGCGNPPSRSAESDSSVTALDQRAVLIWREPSQSLIGYWQVSSQGITNAGLFGQTVPYHYKALGFALFRNDATYALVFRDETDPNGRFPYWKIAP